MNEKAVGYGLLVAGVGLILFSVLNVYFVFSKQIKPVQFFNLPAPQIDYGEIMSGALPQEFRGLAGGGQKQEVVPAVFVNDPMNLIAHLFLMGFVGSAGFKLASLGTLLIRPIEVKVKEKSS